jgi:hypothetical protein
LVSFLDGTLIVVLPLNIITAHASGSGGHGVVVQKNVSVLTIGGNWDSRGIRGKSLPPLHKAVALKNASE